MARTPFFERVTPWAKPRLEVGSRLTLRVGSWSRVHLVEADRGGILVLRPEGRFEAPPVHASTLVLGESATERGLATFGVKVIGFEDGALHVALGSSRIHERRTADRDRHSPPCGGRLDGRPCLILDSCRNGARVLADVAVRAGEKVDVDCAPWTGGAWALDCRTTPAGFEIRVAKFAL